jgi:uncharacterized protein (TIGR03118 family)
MLEAMKKLAVCFLLILSPALLPAATGYLVHNLVADAAATVTPAADFIDPNLVNAWGNVTTAASPFWVCDAGTALSTLYTVNAVAVTPPLGTPNATTKPTIPGPGAAVGKGACTGIVANTSAAAPAGSTPNFAVTAPGKAAVAANFIFVTLDGVLSAWAGGADATQAFLQVDNSKTAIYTGLAIATLTTSTPGTTAVLQLFAANFKSGAIDVFDAQFKPVTLAAGTFTDPKLPAGYAPFNIWNLGGKLYVAYAQQNATKTFNNFGAGLGFVSVFDTTGKLLQSLIVGGTGSLLNAPWGLAIAPATFGKFAGALLVGNFGDGTINAFDPATGAVLGTLQDAGGKNIVIQGLWSLLLGNGGSGGDKDALYFTAGPGNQKHGLLGSITANPTVVSAGITSAAQPTAGIAPNTFITIKGSNLAVTKRTLVAGDIVNNLIPGTVDGVTVTINGQPGFITYISPVQINLVTAAELPTSGPLTVVVSDNTLTSSSVTVTPQLLAPSLFLNGTNAAYAVVLHANGTLVGPTTITGATPAAPGETIIMFGTGFGVTTPAAVSGKIITTAAPLLLTPAILFDNIPGKVAFAGLIATGVYQFNVVVPTGLPDGDTPLVASTGGFSSPGLVLTSIKN